MLREIFDDEPVNRKDMHLYVEASKDMHCSYCLDLIEPEFRQEAPCHSCGEFSFLVTLSPAELEELQSARQAREAARKSSSS